MSSVHYLVPGQGVWAQRASEQTLDLIEDPFWRVTQATIASKDGIVWRCGNALTGIGVERSTDAGLTWSDVTPSTNPPNDNGDSPAPLADNVIYTHIDGSRVAQGTFVVVANWQAGVPSLGDWRSWMAITDDDGVTWRWKGFTPPDGPDLLSTAKFRIDAEIEVFPTVKVISGDGDSGCLAAIYGRDSGFQGGGIYVGGSNLVLISYSGTTAVLEDTHPSTGIADYGSLIKLSDTRIATIFSDGDWDFDTVFVRLYSIDAGCTTLTELDTSVIPSDGLGGLGMTRHMHEVGGSSTRAFITMQIGDERWIRRVEFAGDTITFPGSIIHIENVSTGVASMIIGTSPVGTDATAFLLYPQNSSDYVGVRVVVAEWGTGSTPDIGDEHTIDPLDYDPINFPASNPDWNKECFMNMGGNKYVAVYSATQIPVFGFRVVAVGMIISGTVVTSGPPLYIEPQNVDNAHPVPLDNNWCQIIAKDKSTIIIVHDDLSSEQKGGWTDYPLLGMDDPSHGVFLKYEDGVAKTAAIFPDTAGTPGRKITFFEIELEPGGSGQSKGFGVSLGKDAGLMAWVTVWDESDTLKLLGVDTVQLVFGQDTYSLGVATLPAIDVGLVSAKPYAFYGNDANIVAYGRMTDPQGLGHIIGNDAHIIFSFEGSAFQLTENQWGSSHCGALFVLPNGWMYAMRNDGSNSRFYLGTLAGITVQSVLPFMSGVEQHGLDVDSRDGAIVACARVADPYMVAVSAYPYTLWTNITTDHGILEGINAVAIL